MIVKNKEISKISLDILGETRIGLISFLMVRTNLEITSSILFIFVTHKL